MIKVMAGRRVHLIASLGGHLELLHALAPALADHDRTWTTSEGSRAEELRRSGETVRTLPRLDRGSVRIASFLAGIRLAVRERPELVISSGAGLTVPFAITARLLGARLIFVETMARVTSGSLSGRILSRLGADMVVQWPELRQVYPRAAVCRPTLLESVGESPAPDGRGTFVTVGSHDVPFDRLLEWVDDAADRGLLPEPITVQQGVSTRVPRHGRATPFVSPGEFVAAVRDARVVVTHAGAGAIATALRAGRTPLVMAREAARGEHVDDHQKQLVTRLDQMGLVVLVDGPLTPEQRDRACRPATLDPASSDAWPSVTEVLADLLR
ncbi:glycosyltransferase [Blastococcus montanus]|uniref:glycosyltransferase n=1 Tax=Blastococcus montanus TaxID=3144973 RepID=UPI0032093C31